MKEPMYCRNCGELLMAGGISSHTTYDPYTGEAMAHPAIQFKQCIDHPTGNRWTLLDGVWVNR
jgi:hypothetical protein